MTSAQLQAGRMLIPGAYELRAPAHRATPPDGQAAAIPIQEVNANLAPQAPLHVVAAPTRPTTRLGLAAAVLGDLALCMALIYGVALAPGLAFQGISAAVKLVLGTWGRN